MRDRNNPLISKKRPLIMAHRGNQTSAPENTLPALQNAVNLKIDVIETDIHITKDKEIVLFHDDKLDRTTNLKGFIIDFNLGELKEADLGYHFSLDSGKTFPFRGKGLCVISLREAFEEFPNIKFNLDIKNTEPEVPKFLAKLITKYNRTQSVIVGSFHHNQIQRFRKLLPTAATSASPPEVKKFLIFNKLRIAKILIPQYLAFQVPIIHNDTKIITNNFVKKAHAKNIAVHVWTINNRDDMEWLIDINIDGIFTDKPEILIELLKLRSLI
jgi:glycerophosphoryl diester phosphodiesterase